MATTESVVQIDGAYGEGGGGLVRTALIMSALTQLPVTIRNVRGGTKFPGVDVEDLVIGRVLGQITLASAEGLELGSHEITFRPTKRPQAYNGKIANEINRNGKGANANIVLAAVAPVLATTGAASSVVAEGETYGLRSLGFDSMAHATIPAWRQAGLYTEALLDRAGFGRESDGEVAMEIEPSHIEGFDWMERGELVSIKGVIATNGVSPGISERGVAFLKKLAQGASLPMEAEVVECGAKSPGVHITVVAQYEHGIGVGAAMGSKGLRMEALCTGAFEELFDWLQTPATVDPFLIDQLLIPMVIGHGEVSIRVSRLTSRFLTAVWVVRQFTPILLMIKGTEGNPGVVSIKRG
jgi:RNA 3'-terminal phosphate cyclase (ATP)